MNLPQNIEHYVKILRNTQSISTLFSKTTLLPASKQKLLLQLKIYKLNSNLRALPEHKSLLHI